MVKMSLQEKIEEAVKPALEKARSEAIDGVLDSYKTEDECMLKDLIGKAYASKDLELIGYLHEQLYKFKQNMETKINGGKLIGLVYPIENKEQAESNRKILIEVLNSYSSGFLIPKEELAEKTGLSLKWLSNYTRGRRPLLIKGEGGYYRPEKIPQKESHKEQIKRLKCEKETLISVLNEYNFGAIIPEDELSEKTKLTINQLNCYARRGKNPLLVRIGYGYHLRNKLKKK